MDENTAKSKILHKDAIWRPWPLLLAGCFGLVCFGLVVWVAVLFGLEGRYGAGVVQPSFMVLPLAPLCMLASPVAAVCACLAAIPRHPGPTYRKAVFGICGVLGLVFVAAFAACALHVQQVGGQALWAFLFYGGLLLAAWPLRLLLLLAVAGVVIMACKLRAARRREAQPKEEYGMDNQKTNDNAQNSVPNKNADKMRENTGENVAAPLLPGGPGTAAGQASAPGSARSQRQPFTPARADGLLALMCLVLGFLCVRWLLWQPAMRGWGVAAWCLLFCIAAFSYALAKNIRPGLAAAFWFGIFLLCGLAHGLWPGGLLAPWRALLLVFAGAYGCGCLFGVRLQGKTGNWLPLDAANLLFAMPFANADVQLMSLRGLYTGRREGKRLLRRLLPVAAGLLLAGILAGLLLPMLVLADEQNFGGLVRDASLWLEGLLQNIVAEEVAKVAAQLVLGLVAGALLCGLLAGAAHRRYTSSIDVKKAQKMAAGAHVVPGSTLLLVLGSVCVIYIIFIACQLPYFFSAFGGAKPQQFAQYSQYARAGLFELCRIAAINLSLMALAGSLAKKPMAENRPLRVANLLLCALTLLVLATAFSKMALYMAVHGLTPKRIMTCVFMVFLAGVCVAVMVLQFRRFSVVRFAAVWGAGLLCALCMCNMDGLVASYNAKRYLAGQQAAFDELIIYRGGPAGVPAALQVYHSLPEGEEKMLLAFAINHAAQPAQSIGQPSRGTAVEATVQALSLPHPRDSAEWQRWSLLFHTKHEQQLGWGGSYD